MRSDAAPSRHLPIVLPSRGSSHHAAWNRASIDDPLALLRRGRQRPHGGEQVSVGQVLEQQMPGPCPWVAMRLEAAWHVRRGSDAATLV